MRFGMLGLQAGIIPVLRSERRINILGGYYTTGAAPTLTNGSAAAPRSRFQQLSSISTAPTGCFQTTQPVSGTVTANAGSGTFNVNLSQLDGTNLGAPSAYGTSRRGERSRRKRLRHQYSSGQRDLLPSNPASQHRDHANNSGYGDFLADHTASFRHHHGKSGRDLERRAIRHLDRHSNAGHQIDTAWYTVGLLQFRRFRGQFQFYGRNDPGQHSGPLSDGSRADLDQRLRRARANRFPTAISISIASRAVFRRPSPSREP